MTTTRELGTQPDRVRAAHQKLAPVFDQIAATAVSREAAGELDRDAVHALRDAGYTTLRVPEEYGGAGLSFEEASWFLVALGRADSNLAQALRAHWLHVEDVLSRPADDPATPEFRDRWLRRIGEGAIVGNALTERGNVRGQTVTRLHTTERRDAEGHPVRVLTGEKFYSTGAAYADWILVSATDDDGQPVSAAVPSTAPGITIVDDWDGFGQQLTASGTTRFASTPVPHADIAPPGDGPDSGGRVAFGQALAQYVHLAVLTGIGQAVVEEGAGYVRSRTRGFSHGAAELPGQDPQVLHVVGQASSQIFGARAAFAAILPELARQLQAESDGRILPEIDVDRLYLSVYQAQQVIAPAVLATATAIFEVGGASAASASRGLDRHWRNARVLASHNPLIYRARIIGDWEVNATPVERSYTVGTPGQQQ
ncbi:acyl-CoA dehydrogenase family protein [Citricoccus sp. NR2]|uniref:acyl-CoA dehydrogenase family protein n=1 Tax=Citricoccus sp. NR2 TaxID=3004095 RepID=UPI0022DD9F4D|nr:acyl-CoA dehydrogenase family protein [Citricoccus sp. NR2]WBL19260.1 acyl-CoA dehydrogenase family protein [Citricoccus sp. NR2]